MKKINKEIDKVIEIVGTQAKLASLLNVSNNAVSKWVAQGYIPLKRAVAVAELVRGEVTEQGKCVTLESLLLEALHSMQR